MSEIIFKDVCKRFKLSRKQAAINRSSKRYVEACRNVNLTVERNEIFGLLGPNGAGKTTALRMLATLIKPDAGTVEIGGLDAFKNQRKVKARIAFLTNDLKLDDQFTPRYLFDFFSALHKVPKELVSERRAKLFTAFEITRFAEVKIKSLSQGMRQKVALAIALVNDPEVIIFDEPTNGLDVVTAQLVINYLEELKRQGKTIILSTHIMSVVERLCDRVAIMVDGQIALVEAVADLKARNVMIEDLFYQLCVDLGGKKA